MHFTEFVAAQQRHLKEMLKAKTLYVVDIAKDQLWDIYISSFPAGTNNVYRERTEHDCNTCKSFIRGFGGVVTIDPVKGMVTAWDFRTDDSTYQPVIDALAKAVRAAKIRDVFVTDLLKFGTEKNHEDSESGVLTWTHLHCVLPDRFMFLATPDFASPASLAGRLRDLRNVFKRGAEEITDDAIETVLDLISANSLYRGEEKANALEKFKAARVAYKKLKSDKARDLYCWHALEVMHPGVLGMRNDLLGTLLVDISEGVDLEEAVRKYESKAAPENYRRSTPVFTKAMLDAAQKTVESLGLMSSLGRRHAIIDDITVNNVLFVNKDVAKRVAANPFEEMTEGTAVNPKNFDRLETISVDKFMEDVLPRVKGLEVFFHTQHKNNLVSLIAPSDRSAPSIMRWNNNFGWAYNGNLADSSLKQAVAKAGGKVDGVLRCSIQWGDKDRDNNDLDLHCHTPHYSRRHDSREGHISYSATSGHVCGGNLDVDIQRPLEDERAVNGVAVENITWPGLERMKEGEYRFFVNNFAHRGGRLGFRAEIEFDGQVFQYSYDKNVNDKENVEIAVVRYSRARGFEIVRSLDGSSMLTKSEDVWGIKTNQFHPVTICCLSPNFWDGQEEVGNRHVMFMLHGCKNESSPNGFFNEFLRPEFTKHRKVFEALGGKMRVEPSDSQLSGLGFSTTKRAEVVVRTTGSVKRMFKITF